MELNDLDRINEAKRLISGVRDSMIMMENFAVRETNEDVYYMLENALETAASLLEEVTKDAETTAEIKSAKE